MRSIFIPLTLVFAALLLLLIAARPASAQQPSAVLLWPVNPVIKADRQAAALWLENPGKTPVTLQVRIYAWAQHDGENLYAEQRDVIGTPPITTIAPGAKQLVRLTRMNAAPIEAEKPYRLIIDEIPIERAAKAAPGPAISFRMRYSLPLFVLGHPTLAKGGAANAPPPLLAWRAIPGAPNGFVEISNNGALHVRLTNASVGGVPLSAGLLGYVLPGQAMRWPLPAGANAAADLCASVDGAPSAPIARRID